MKLWPAIFFAMILGPFTTAWAQTTTAAPVNASVPAAVANVPANSMNVPMLAPTPAPVSTPAPIVGVNADPVPAQNVPTPSVSSQVNSQAQPALPAGYPGAATPAPNTAIQPSANTPKKPDPAPLKSEIIAVPSGAQKSAALRAVLRTSVGDITIRLDHAKAPHTVDYFVGLARGEQDFVDIKTSKPVKRPFYNGLIFHRVVKDTLIQTGDPFGTGRGGSGQTLPDEIQPSMKFEHAGMVAMAPMRATAGTSLSKNSNSTQFFITLRPMPDWNNQFTIFGQVEDGLDIVEKIANQKVGPTERPVKRVVLIAIDIIE